jgi:hypothetical protein
LLFITFPPLISACVLPLQAAQNVLVEHWSSSNGDSSSSGRLRQLTAADLLQAASHVQPSVSKAQEYSQGLHGSASFDAGGGSSGAAGLAGMAHIMAALAAASSGSSSRHGGAAGMNGRRKSRAAAAAAGDAEDVEAGAAAGGDVDSEEARRDEMYKLIGKMVMGSMGGAL